MALAFLRERRQKAAVDSRHWPSSLAIAVGAIACCLTVTAPIRADEPVRVVVRDPTVFPESGARYRLMGFGAGVALGSYGLALGAYLADPNVPGVPELRIPVVGPWLAIAETGCPSSDPECPIAPRVIRGVLMGLDGILQLGGLALIGEGLFMPTGPVMPTGPGSRAELALHRDRAGQTHISRSNARSLWIRPIPFVSGRDGFGVGFAGRF